MAKPTQVARMEFELFVRINGVTYRASDISLNFGLNKIPSARASLAIGRDARTLERAKIHDTANDLRMLVPAEILFRPKGEWSPSDSGYARGTGRWDAAGEQIIFSGYLTGTGYRKQRGEVRYSVYLTHWLADLNFSSALSNQSHPANPARFRWRAIYGSQSGFILGPPNFLFTSTSRPLFQPERLRKDTWGASLHPFFCEMSKQDALNKLSGDKCGGLGGSNAAAQNALRRFEKATGDKDEIGADCETGAKSPYWKPLAFKMGFVEKIIAESISEFVGRGKEESYFSSTIWDKLVGVLGPAFGYSIVPRVHTAMVVPFVPGLRTTFDQEFDNGKVLDLKDISYIDSSAVVPRPLRAVGVVQASPSSRTGAFERVPFLSLGGCYAPGGDKGMVIYKYPPPWLAGAPHHAQDMGITALGRKPHPNSGTTPVAPGTSAGDATGETPISASNKLKDYYANTAHHFYAMEMLRGRFAVVQGKLRFDLAPGTNVAIRNAKPLFINGDQLSQDAVASVIRVGIVMNAEAAQAGTSFQLEHLRTEGENEDPKTSVERHPLYEEIFTGAPLLHDYLFPE
mgnify:CR=1 FL=1